MSVSLYSFFMAILWFSTFILFGTLLQSKTSLVICGQLGPLLFLIGLTVFRLVIPLETSFTRVIPSTAIYPSVQKFFNSSWIMVCGISFSGIDVLFVIWICGSIALCFRLCLHIYSDSRIVNVLSTVDCQNAEQSLTQLLSRRKCLRKVELVATPEISTPMLVGLFKPKILFPQACVNFSELELQSILSHELTHFFMGDVWVKFFVRLLCCLLWWNPCVYLLKKDLDYILEFKCDLAVTKNMGDAEKVMYLQTVMTILSQMEKNTQSKVNQTLQASFCGISETTILKQRFQLVLHQKHKRVPTIAFIAILLMSFIASYSIVLQPASAPPADDLAGEFFITPDTSYILLTSEDTYYLIYEGTPLEQLSPEVLQTPPYSDLTILNDIKGDLT